jgi:hypothetical protein
MTNVHVPLSQTPPDTRGGKLPEAPELLRQHKKGATLTAIGVRYGASRQAVHKRIKKWLDKNPQPVESQDSQVAP